MTQTDGGQKTIWLTQDAYDKLQAELEHLQGPGTHAADGALAQLLAGRAGQGHGGDG